MMKLLTRILSLALVLTLLLGCTVHGEEAAEYVHFICSPSQTAVTVVSLEAVYEDELSVKAKKALLSDWDGVSATLGEGDLVYRVTEQAHMPGMVHAFALDEGIYFVKAEAKDYAPLNWTAVSVRYDNGPMQMKLSLQPASAVPEQPAVPTASPAQDESADVLPKEDSAELQRVVFWCDPANVSLTVQRDDGEKIAPTSVSGAGESSMDLVAVAEYVYLLPEGHYAYSASCAGYIPKENVPFTVDGDKVIDLSLKSEIRSVQVTIVVSEGQEITRVYKADDPAERPLSADKDGMYGLAPGYYQCAVKSADGEKVYNLTVSGDRAEQMFQLNPLALVERSTQAVVFEKWQEEIELTVYTVDAAGDKVICEPDENGVYTLPVGTVWYDATAAGYVPVEAQPVQVKPSLETQVERVWLLSESRSGVNRSTNVVIFAAIAEKSGAQAFSAELQAMMDELGLVRADYFYSTKRADGKYETVYYGTLAEDNVWFAVDMLNTSDEIAFAEPEYLYFTTAEELDNAWYTGDQSYLEQQTWLEPQGIRAIWGDLEQQGITPGEGVVVAVIDTGVDYTHPDLKNNIWTNWMELDGAEGVDDDGNGYVDDVYGWNFVSENNNVQDDHGHGTHVAGIIAMADNGVGGVGIAYGAKVMAIKAGQASGTFSSMAIARAVMYAQACGADIINMSFGSYDESTIVENALKAAYTDCLLVAAAGNDAMPALPIIPGANMYPAAYSYVLGVMATNDAGEVLADFSNYDTIVAVGGEYELAAPGISIYSTLPGDRYARWSGTSMAAPVVSGAAAVLMSTGDSGSRYVMGQLVGASKKEIYKGFASFDLASSLESTPIPELSLLEVVASDDPAFDGGAVNNGDGVFQNGETIELGIKVRNRWGAAVDVQIDATSLVNGVDPGFVTWVDNTATISAVGTFADADTGFVYNDGELVSVSDPLRFVIGKDVAHNVEIPITFNVTAKNGMDSADNTVYAWGEKEGFTYVLTVENGYYISGILAEDTTLTNDRLWIIRGSLQVPEGITLTVEAGTRIHFERVYTGNFAIDEQNYPFLEILGAARFNGTQAEPISITTDSTLAIVGDLAWYTSKYNLPILWYNSTQFFSAPDCVMYYVNIDGNVDALENLYRSSVATLTYGEHVKIVDCHIRVERLVESYLDGCILNYYHSCDNATASYVADTCFFTNCYFGQMGSLTGLVSTLNNCVFQDNETMNYYWPFASEDSIVSNNAFLNRLNTPAEWFRPAANDGNDRDLTNNFWGTDSATVVGDIILDSSEIVSDGTITYEPFLTKSSDMSSIYPFVVDAWITDAAGNRIEDVIGAQEVTFHVLFNRDMNTNDDLTVAYGPAEPYNDYRVTGEWKSARKWEGTYQVNPVIDYGTMYIYVAGGHAADDYWLETAPDSRHWFEISNVGAEALTLQSWAEGDGIHLTWTQDDFETLAGYNLYRTQTLGEICDEYGQVIGTGPVGAEKINPVLIPSDTLSYVDANVVEGETYHYYFTVVQTDFAESDGSNVTTCTALDMTKPVIEHTPIASVVTGQPLSVSATVTDNVKVDSVTLYTRVQGDSAWTATTMINTSGSLWYANMVVNGTKPVEYYISATDGVCTATCGTAEAPQTVVVESGAATLGDVNADGSIDILDLMLMTQSIVGTKTLTVMQNKAADVNVDNVVDVFDLMRVAQYICGVIGSL